MFSDKHAPTNPSLPIQSSHTETRARLASFIAILFLTALVVSGCVIHDRGHHRSAHHSSTVVVQPRAPIAVAPAPITFTFTNHHRHLAHSYYYDHPHIHGKGPKWKQRWRHKRRSHLSPGLRMQALPYELTRQLPPAPRGTRYIYDDDQVLLVNVNNREVIDFINISLSVDAPVTVAPAPVVFAFNDRHRHSVRNYYHRHPHGKFKKHKWKKKRKHKRKGRDRDHRPRGWVRQDVLPEEVRLERIHDDLARQLPRPPRGARYTYHEDQVLLIDLRTRVVLDFIDISVSAGF